MTHTHAPAEATGHRGDHPLPRASQAFTCAPCAVTWSGQESDCWSCGQPATSPHPCDGCTVSTEPVTRTLAVDFLLAAAGHALLTGQLVTA